MIIKSVCTQFLQTTHLLLRIMVNMDANNGDSILTYQFSMELPDILKDQLIFCGYESLTSIKESSADWINDIEQFIKSVLKESPEEVVLRYCGPLFVKNLEVFKILPGHKVILQKIKKELTASAQVHLERAARVKQPTTSKSVSSQNSECAENLKTKLVELVKAFIQNESILNKISPEVLKSWFKKIEYEVVMDNQKGYIKCICGKKVATHLHNTQKKMKWIISNFKDHFKRHVKSCFPQTGNQGNASDNLQKKSLHNLKITKYFATSSSPETSSVLTLSDSDTSEDISESSVKILAVEPCIDNHVYIQEHDYNSIFAAIRPGHTFNEITLKDEELEEDETEYGVLFQNDNMEVIDEYENNDPAIYTLNGPLSLKHYGKVDSNTKVNPKSPFVAVKTETMTTPVLIKKSSLVWRFRNSPTRVSCDRLYRYKN